MNIVSTLDKKIKQLQKQKESLSKILKKIEEYNHGRLDQDDDFFHDELSITWTIRIKSHSFNYKSEWTEDAYPNLDYEDQDNIDTWLDMAGAKLDSEIRECREQSLAVNRNKVRR